MTASSGLVTLLRDEKVTNVDIDWEDLLLLIESRSHELLCSRHPLGFLHIELTPIVQLNAGERLRLHYWPSLGANADAIGSLHDHVWHLASVVAAGRLRDRTLRPVRDPEGDYEGTRVDYSNQGNAFVREGMFSLTFEREIVVGPNMVYRVPSRVVHDSSVVEAPAVTFVLARDDDRAASDGPLILQRPGGRSEGTAVRSPFDVTKALKLVRARVGAL